MRHALAALLLALTALTATAQKEHDFALTYMNLYAEGTTLSCQTVGPAMISKMLAQPQADDDPDMKQALKKIRSLRVVANTKKSETATLYDKAAALLKANSARYAHYADYDGKSLYLRRRGKDILELVLLTRQDSCLHIVDVTGTMDEDFLRQLTGR